MYDHALSSHAAATRRESGAEEPPPMNETKQPTELPDLIKDHLARYIATDGEDGYLWDARLGGGTGLVPTLLLTTVGRKSGKPLTMPLIFGRSGPDYMVVASKGGAPAHPAWYLNLAANPQVRVQVKAQKFAALARTANPEERLALWPKMVEIYAPYAQYQTKTDRQIPVVILRPVAASTPSSR
jgi:deazaflavin-dependent oxidoreductase (nitroreductase family)